MRKVIFIIPILISVLSLQSCMGLLVRNTVQKTITVEKSVVPADFINKDETLLILLWTDKHYDKYVQKAFDRFYTGKKIYLTMYDYHNNPSYSDVNSYPFVFSQGPGELSMYESTSYTFTYEGSRPFHIFDRRNKSFYQSYLTSGLYYRVLEAYARKLDYYQKTRNF